MLIIINGTIGVGKTWVARTLLCNLKNAAYIEGDNLGFVSKELLKKNSRKDFISEVALELIKIYQDQGAENIVFDNLFLDEETLKWFLDRARMTYQVFYLSASQDVLKKRIEERARPQYERERKEAGDIERTQRKNLSPEFFGHEIITDKLRSDEISDQILKILKANVPKEAGRIHGATGT